MPVECPYFVHVESSERHIASDAISNFGYDKGWEAIVKFNEALQTIFKSDKNKYFREDDSYADVGENELSYNFINEDNGSLWYMRELSGT